MDRTMPEIDWFSIQERLVRRNVKRFRGGLVFTAHRLSYHSTLDPRVIKKKKLSVYLPAARKVDVGLPGKGKFKPPWREAGPPNHLDDKVDSDQ